MTTTSPWARQATPPAPPNPGMPLPPVVTAPNPPPPAAPSTARPVRRRRRWPWIVLLVLLVAAAAAVGSVVTYAVTRTDSAASAAQPSAATPPTAQFSAAEANTAKQNLCQTFDVSVRGQQGQGGLRVAGGGVNVPVTLRALNSATAVQTALVPATPPDVAAAAKRYVSTTLDVTTAAMGNTPTSEVNRLTDVNNDALFALIDVCGLPR